MPAALANLIPLILLIVVMYFLMIRPQKKKDKQIQDMRKALTVGDEIVTIGGICGKIGIFQRIRAPSLGSGPDLPLVNDHRIGRHFEFRISAERLAAP